MLVTAEKKLQKWFLLLGRFSQPPVCTEKMLNIQIIQWALAGKCLNLLFAVVHHGQHLCSLVFFFFLYTQGVDCLMISG
jgi:hypothetical protein